MAIHATVETMHGDIRTLYIRLNNVEISNHGVPARATFRGFVSQEAFEAGKHFLFEKDIEFPVDVHLPIWSLAYAALRAEPEFTDATDS